MNELIGVVLAAGVLYYFIKRNKNKSTECDSPVPGGCGAAYKVEANKVTAAVDTVDTIEEAVEEAIEDAEIVLSSIKAGIASNRLNTLVRDAAKLLGIEITKTEVVNGIGAKVAMNTVKASDLKKIKDFYEEAHRTNPTKYSEAKATDLAAIVNSIK